MKCHILFSVKNKKYISKCRLLQILPRVLSVKGGKRKRAETSVNVPSHNENSDQSAHARSLIRVIARTLAALAIQNAPCGGSDQTT